MARRKQRTRKRNPKLRILLILAFVVGFIAVGLYILSLPIWEIRDVVVNGAKMLSPDQVRGLAGVPLNENLFFTSLDRSKSNLKKIPAVKSFRIYRIPPATILISITERQPIAAIVFPKKSVIIDEFGYILNQNPKISLNIPNQADLPVVSGINEKKALKDKTVDRDVSRVVTEVILKLSRFLESGKMHLELGKLENISFLLDDLLRVKLGNDQKIKHKMEVFEALLPVISKKWSRVDYMDVRYPNNPVIKYK